MEPPFVSSRRYLLVQMLVMQGAGLLQATMRASCETDDGYPDWEGHRTPPASLEGRDEVGCGIPASLAQLL